MPGLADHPKPEPAMAPTPERAYANTQNTETLPHDNCLRRQREHSEAVATVVPGRHAGEPGFDARAGRYNNDRNNLSVLATAPLLNHEDVTSLTPELSRPAKRVRLE